MLVDALPFFMNYPGYQEVADMLNKDKRTIQRWIRVGILPSKRIVRTPYVSGENLIKLLEKKE